MKQGFRATMPVALTGIDPADIARIEFIFRDGMSVSNRMLKAVEYPGDVIQGQEPGTFLIPWTVQETYLVPAGGAFYMDTRVHLVSSEDMPVTPIVRLTMMRSLFEREEDDP